MRTTKGVTKVARRKHVVPEANTLTAEPAPSPNGGAGKDAHPITAASTGERVAAALAALVEIDLRRVKDPDLRADLKEARQLLNLCARQIRHPE